MRRDPSRPSRRREARKRGFIISFGDIILPFVGIMAIGLLVVAGRLFFANGLHSSSSAAPPQPVPSVPDTGLEELYPSPPQAPTPPARSAASEEEPAASPKDTGGSRSEPGEITLAVEVTTTPVDESTEMGVDPGLEETAVPASGANPAPSSPSPAPSAAAAPRGTNTPAKRPAANSSQPSWRVQVGAYGSKRAAEEVVGKLAKSGYTATVFSSSASKYHKVWVQAGATRAAAEAAVSRLKVLGYPGSYVVPPPAK